MREVHERIARQLSGRKPCIVIAHSLGSVIAYNHLIQHPELNVQRFITLGSPLAFQVIQSSWHSRWYDLRQLKATGSISIQRMIISPPFRLPNRHSSLNLKSSIMAFVHIHRPHDITGYLLHPQVVEAFWNCLKIRPKSCIFQVFY